MLGPMGMCLLLSSGFRLGATFGPDLVSFRVVQSLFRSLHGRLPTYFPFISFIARA